MLEVDSRSLHHNSVAYSVVMGSFINRLFAMYVEGKINNMLVTMETEKVVQLVSFKQTPYACVLIEYTVFTRTVNCIHSVQKNTAENTGKKVVQKQ
jgi:hypothetical protein